MDTEAAIITFNGHEAQAGSGEPESLVARAQSGDWGAFDGLMRAHQRQVFGTARRLLGSPEDAQDAAQEVFLRLYRYLDRLDSGRALAPWLYRVTVNVCRDLARRRRVRRTVSLQEAGEAGLPEPRDPRADPAAAAVVAEEHRIVEEGIATLAEKERSALVLRDVEGLSTAEVAAILGTTETTVRSHICRARLKIKKYRDRRLAERTLP